MAPLEIIESLEERTEKRCDSSYKDLCKVSAVVKEGYDFHLNLLKDAPVIKTDGSHISNENDLLARRTEIEDLKRQIRELREEIETTKMEKSSKQRHAAQCCKVITGLLIGESEGQLVGMSDSALFTHDAKDPELTSKLWDRVENLPTM